jgi:hypothetical protein
MVRQFCKLDDEKHRSTWAHTCFVQRHEPEGGGVDGVADLLNSASAGMLIAMGSSGISSETYR